MACNYAWFLGLPMKGMIPSTASAVRRGRVIDNVPDRKEVALVENGMAGVAMLVVHWWCWLVVIARIGVGLMGVGLGVEGVSTANPCPLQSGQYRPAVSTHSARDCF